MRERFEGAMTFPEYLDTVEKNEELWKGIYDRVELPDDVLTKARELPGPWHLLALSEDWCGDAVNILPVVARLAEAAADLHLRVLTRDDNLDLMDAHLTSGRSRSIPVVMILDGDYREVGWWGPRPTELQRWVMDEGMKMESTDRYKRTRAFYAQDKGRTTLEELVGLMASLTVSGSHG